MDQESNDRQMYSATCSSCGKEAQVPFQPSGDRPVYCRDCFAKQRSERRPREMHDVTCNACGTQTQVPFKPTGEKPVYCRDCFAKQRSGE